MPPSVTPNSQPPASFPTLRAYLRGKHHTANPHDGLTVTVDEFRRGTDSEDRFCRVRVKFLACDPDGQNFVLELTNAPFDDRITKIVKGGTRKGTCDTSPPEGANLTLSLSLRDIKGVKSLARSLNSLFRRYREAGCRYPNPNWKWSCPKTVTALRVLAGHLEEYKLLRMVRSTLFVGPASLPPGGSATKVPHLATSGTPRKRTVTSTPHPSPTPEPDLFDLIHESRGP